jgi:hypothetical protein
LRTERGQLLVLAALVSCGRGPEEEVLRKFFLATQAKDADSLFGVSAVAFPGKVGDFRIVESLPVRTEPFRLPELQREHEQAEQARDEQFEAFSRFRTENFETLKTMEDQLLKDPGRRFTGQRAELHATWQEFREERRSLETRVREAKANREAEEKRASRSLLSPADLSRCQGETRLRQVRVSVRESGGAEKTYQFTLIQYALTDPAGGRVLPARWLITDIEEE